MVAVPVVRATGGLDDTIDSFDLQHGTGTGFKFSEYSGAALLYAIRQALHHYSNEGIWKRIQLNGMAKDFSWNISAAWNMRNYMRLPEQRETLSRLQHLIRKISGCAVAAAKGYRNVMAENILA